MGFSLDFNDTFEGRIQDGEYEVVIAKVLPKTTTNGVEHISFDMIVRNDIDQKFKNAHVFHSIWKAKETGKYNMKNFNTIGKAAQLQNGKTYNSFDDLLADYEGKTLKVKVKNETSDYNGKTYENLNVKAWLPTAFPNLQHQWKDGAPSTKLAVTESDLPF